MATGSTDVSTICPPHGHGPDVGGGSCASDGKHKAGSATDPSTSIELDPEFITLNELVTIADECAFSACSGIMLPRASRLMQRTTTVTTDSVSW